MGGGEGAQALPVIQLVRFLEGGAREGGRRRGERRRLGKRLFLVEQTNPVGVKRGEGGAENPDL